MKFRTIIYTALTFFFICYFQNCVVYQSNTLSLQESVDKGKVKVVDSKGVSYRFENIAMVDGTYLGSGGPYNNLPYVITASGPKTKLDSALVEVVYLKDRKKSTSRTVWLAILSVPAAFAFTGIVVNLTGIW